MDDGPGIVAGRSCEGCAMCCWLPWITALDKPAGVWCRHAPTRARCEIYADRPGACRAFHCGWLTMPELGEDWRPARCGFYVADDGRRVVVHVDPARAGAWCAAPHLGRLRDWAATRGPVVVRTGEQHHLVLAEGELDLGRIGPGEEAQIARDPETGVLRVSVGPAPQRSA